jgi:hypothetical protein
MKIKALLTFFFVLFLFLNYSCGMQYHYHPATFGDEIKIDLPLLLKPSHHLLFSFYHVSCKVCCSDRVLVCVDGAFFIFFF